jgi:hypothetical protein
MSTCHSVPISVCLPLNNARIKRDKRSRSSLLRCTINLRILGQKSFSTLTEIERTYLRQHTRDTLLKRHRRLCNSNAVREILPITRLHPSASISTSPSLLLSPSPLDRKSKEDLPRMHSHRNHGRVFKMHLPYKVVRSRFTNSICERWCCAFHVVYTSQTGGDEDHLGRGRQEGVEGLECVDGEQGVGFEVCEQGIQRGGEGGQEGGACAGVED